LAQQAPPGAKQEPPGAKPAESPAGRYSVSPAGTTAVLLDTASGKTWVLRHAAVGEPVWVPARRLDTADEVRRWQELEEVRRHRAGAPAVAFGPDGRLFTGGLDTVVLGWDVRPPRVPARGTLADAWDALAASDAGAGFQAQGRFLAEPGQAVAWFAARLTPAFLPDPSRVKALIGDLDADDFATRARATAGLKDH